MATKKNTDIKFSQIKKSAKLTHQTEKYELEDGSTITFYPTFPSTLIDELLSEAQQILQTKGDKVLSDELTHKYFLFMCIKHFTHLKSQLKSTTLQGQLNEMESIMDTFVEDGRIDLFSLIVDEIFPQKEIHKVFDKLGKFGGVYEFSERMNQKIQDEVSRLELKNKEIFANLNFKQPKDESDVVQ